MASEFKIKNGLIVVGDVSTSGTITINGALAATQSWVTSQAYLTSSSLTSYATQSYVTSAIASLVDSAPGALDTLRELATALGNDASFSTTVTNSIAAKLPLAGGTLTGALTGTSATFSGNVTLGNNSDLVFQDLAGTFPTSGKGFDWTLNNDGARIYAIQPNSDSIDFVFQLRDNATTNDRFVFWVDEWQGPAYDKYPLIISGGTEFDLKDSSLYTNTVLRLSNSGVLQNVTGNISMFTNNSGYLTSYTETDTLQSVTNRGGTTTNRLEFQYSVDRYSQAWKNTSTGAFWWVTTDADKLGLHRNADGDKFYFSNTGDFYSVTNGWLSTALAAKQNAATAITTSNIASQSVSYANSAGSAGYVNNQSGQLYSYDNRIISPSETNASYLQFGFTSWANNNSAPYADYLHLRSYPDSSGGSDNLVMFLKSGIGMRIYQQTFGSGSAYSSYADVWHSGNLTNLNQLSNGPGYITSYSETDTLASVTGRGASTSTNITFNGTITANSSIVQGYGTILTGYNSGFQITVNATYSGGQTNTYTPQYAGGGSAGMFVMKQRNGGEGIMDFYGKQSGTDGSTQAYSTFNHLMTMLPTGNVGIGTTSPGYKLDVSGNSRTTGIHYVDTYLVTPYIYGGGPITMGNDVTITSATAWNASAARLNVGGTGDGRIQVRHIYGKSSASAAADHLWLQYQNTGSHVQIGDSGGGNHLYVSGNIYMGGYFAGNLVATQSWVSSQNYLTSYSETDTLASVTGRGATTNTSITVGPDLTVQADGSVGYTASRLWLNSHNNYRGAGVHMSGVGSTWFAGTPYTDFDGGYVISRTGTSNDQSSAQYSNALLTVKSTGNVGIGTSSPNYKLHVSGNAYINETLYVNQATTIEDTFTVKTQNGSYNVAVIDYSGTAGGRIKVYTDGILRSQIGSYYGDDTFFNVGYGGNVGIGTSSPSTKLNIYSDTTADGILVDILSRPRITLRDRGNSDTIIGTGDYGLDDFFIDTYSGNALAIKGSTRNVGIGTTSPNEKLQVAGNINAYVNGGIDAGLFASTSAGSTTIALRSNGITHFNGGNVGIGTTSPGWKLHVAGESYTSGVVRIGGSSPLYFEDYGGGWYMADSTWVRTYNGKSVWVGGGLLGGDGGLTIGYGGTSYGTNNAIIAGNVGIGTSSPAKKLHVVGDAWINRPTNKVDNNGATEFGSRVEFNNAFTAGSTGYTVFNYPSAAVFRIYADYDGNVGGVQPDLQLGLGYLTVKNSGGTIGNIGIGTTSPNTKLHVSAGNFLISGTAIGGGADANSGLRIVAPISTTHYNWMLGAQQNINSAFEITPSTTVGGTTFSTPTAVFLQNGNVGIGTTNPSYKLDVNGTFGASGAAVIGGNLSVGTTYAGFAANIAGTLYVIGGDLFLSDGYTVRNASNNSSIAFNTSALSFTGAATFSSSITSTSGNITANGDIVANSGGSTAVYVYNASSVRAKLSMTGNEGDLSLYGSSANRLVYLSAYYDSYIVAGKVGIGTTSPANKLVVTSDASPTNENTYAIAAASASDPAYKTIIGYDYTNDIGLIAAVRTGIGWRNLSIPQGSLGIGTYSPNAKLDVVGNTRFGSGSFNVSTDQSFGSAGQYNFRDAVAIWNPNSTSAPNTTAVMSIGSMTNGVSLVTTGQINASGGNSTNWNTAYGWGNHASAGYLTSVSDIWVNTAGDTMTGSLSFSEASVIKKRFTTGTNNPVKTASGVLASRSDNSGGSTYYIIETNVPQDDYQMGGFTIEIFGNYNSTNHKSKIDLGGYWNPETNGGFIGFEAHGSNPQYKPTIEVARNSSGKTVFIIYGLSWSYPVIVARDLWLGYNGTDGGTYGEGWSIIGTSDISSYVNRDTVVWRNAYSDSNPSGYITGYTETDTLQSVTSRGASTNTGLYINNNNPTLYLQDTDHRSAMIHVNSDYFYILNGAGTNSTGWAQQANSRWLFMGNLNNNDITFGGSGDFAGTVTASGGNSSNWNTAYGWGNHASYSYATTSYVTTQINNLIAGAPGALDTLDELAAALGDDASFATTVTNSIAGKVSKAGDTITSSNQYGLIINHTPALGDFVDALILRSTTSGQRAQLGFATVDSDGDHHRASIRAYKGTGSHEGVFGIALRQPSATHIQRLTLDYLGNLTIGGFLTESSSIKLKENVETSEGNLEKVVNLRPVTYNKIGSQTKELGLIAEEVATVYPEFVQYDESGEPVGVNYSRLTAALIGAVKELSSEVKELKKQING